AGRYAETPPLSELSLTPSSCRSAHTRPDPDPTVEPGDGIYAAIIPPGWGHELRATTTPSQRMAQEAHGPKAEPAPFETLVPEQYQDFRDIFSKEAFDQLPPQK